MIQIHTFKKKKERGEGKPQIWWPMEGSKLGGQWGNILFGGHWKVPSLVVNGETSCLVAIGRFQAWWPLK